MNARPESATAGHHPGDRAADDQLARSVGAARRTVNNEGMLYRQLHFLRRVQQPDDRIFWDIEQEIGRIQDEIERRRS